MKIKFYLRCCIVSLLCLQACHEEQLQQLESKNGFAVLPKVQPHLQVADFAGGCFWTMQQCMMEIKGVNNVVSGYAGGHTKNPTYETVLTKTTGHAESVQVYYDPAVISYKKLVELCFYMHDPTQQDRQGPDIGSDYRSIAFHRSVEEYKTIRRVIDSLDSSHLYPAAIVTEIKPFSSFYPAESEHQDYYLKNPWNLYIRKVSQPKVVMFKKRFPTLIKNVKNQQS
ncbi:peptide-methionine (S)-S-oxide reductase MsrA [Pedobacter sp.]|uniref:peptide-methionine (S)-S-oxide reductase MsrA n=1 Tax=Pedobacter sp. TaxID=1411316 RepID=UPI003D7FB8BD